ncbi:MAG TPA: VWA domain-containing protein [Candidatus Angelobacter sp.]|nr:VWA domain-containing protein [Candidatus Angelobacter sp.]
MGRLKLIFITASFLCWLSNAAHAQSSGQSSPDSQLPTLTSRSNLVLVPVLVKTKAGKIVFSLASDDFSLTDDGIAQGARIEEGALGLPLSLVVIVQTGGQGAAHLEDYRRLGAVLDAVVGGVPHHVAVVGFDSKPRLEHDFTTDTDVAARKIAALEGGDQGAAILDAVNFGIDLLRQQPPSYRRAVLLFSETVDHTSQASLDDAVRAVEDTNTAIFSFSFSTTRAAVKHEASKLPSPGGTGYSNEPYAPGGCMSRDPKADPDAHGNRAAQTLDCASDLIPPLRLARMAFTAAREGLKRNVPKSVAQLTGGEYFAFKDAKTLTQALINISNDVPNYYILSFTPKAPHPGLHALELRIRTKPEMEITAARKGYWVDAAADQKQ